MISDQRLNYFTVLGLLPGATVESIKKAYRLKARQYHPDINHSEGASDMFIKVNEAYEFLLAAPYQKPSAQTDFEREWHEKRRQEAKERARAWSAQSFSEFQKTTNYKSSRIYDLISLIMALTISVIIITMSIYGYWWRFITATNDLEKPSVTVMIITLTTGILFLAFSLLYLSSYISIQRKIKQKYAKNK